MDDALIVGVDDSGARSKSELQGKTASRCDATVGSFRDSNRDLSVN